MKTYSFQTVDNFRIDVKASSPKAGYNKLFKIHGTRVTNRYITYDKDGIGDYNFQPLH